MKNAYINDVHFTGCPIPTQQIMATRINYPNAEIYYEIQLETIDVWRGLCACAKLFSDSGLHCISIRYAEGSTIFVRFKDIGTGELKQLELSLRRQRVVALQSWVTMICSVSP